MNIETTSDRDAGEKAENLCHIPQNVFHFVINVMVFMMLVIYGARVFKRQLLKALMSLLSLTFMFLCSMKI